MAVNVRALSRNLTACSDSYEYYKNYFIVNIYQLLLKSVDEKVSKKADRLESTKYILPP